MAKTFRAWSPYQEHLFPRSLKEFVPEGHTAHFIVQLVMHELNLLAILESYTEERGYPPHSPKMMTALLLYGYMRGVYSSRRLSQACDERTDFMVITGMTKPDHRAIASFRKRHRDALAGLFQQVVKLCEKAGLVTLEHVAIDGTKIQANASYSKGMTYGEIKKTEEELSRRWLEEAERIDAEEDEIHGDKRGDEFPTAKEALDRIRKAKAELEEEDKEKRIGREKAEKEGRKPQSKTKKRTAPPSEARYNFTDPESGLMKSRQGFVQAYNSQIAVDSEHQVIVACDVSRAKNDLEELIPLVEQITRNLGRNPDEVSADTGYCSTENLSVMKRRKIRAYIPRSEKMADKGVVREMTLQLRKAGRRSRYRLRKQVVEPVFGTMKSARGFIQFRMRGLQNVATEWALACSAHNLWKLSRAI
jgi:transposase